MECLCQNSKIDNIADTKRDFDSLGDFGLYTSGNKVTDKPEILFARLDVNEVLEKVKPQVDKRLFDLIYPIKKDRFAKDYKIVSDSYSLDTEYIPNFICKTTGETFKGQPFPEFMQRIIKAEGLVNYINNK